MRGRSFVAAVLTAGVLLFTPAVAANAAPPIVTDDLLDAVTVDAVRAHQAEFQEFADLSDGTREASTLGYQLSADYVAGSDGCGRVRGDAAAVRVQLLRGDWRPPSSPAPRRGSRSPTPTVRTSRRWTTPARGTVTGVVQGVNDNIVPLPVGQPDSTSNAGCEDADFTGFTGDIALIQRGTCFFSRRSPTRSRRAPLP